MVLRRRAMTVDAIAHYVLPGLVLAFLIGETRTGALPLVGAIVAAVGGTVLLRILASLRPLTYDSATALTLSGFFGLGVIGISLWVRHADLDVDCVLFGDLAYVPFDLTEIGMWRVSRSVVVSLVTVVLTGTVALLGWRPLVWSALDERWARLVGLNTRLWEALLLIVVAAVCVSAFEVAGLVMVVGLMVGVPVLARVLCTSPRTMVIVSAVGGALCGVGGTLVAHLLNVPYGGAIALCSVVPALTVLFFSGR